jgi:hypothetical protein
LKTKSNERGKLKIGDDWNAIRIIALSQSNPLKAIAEFVESSIDAHARTITITRGANTARITSQSRMMATACRKMPTAYPISSASAPILRLDQAAAESRRPRRGRAGQYLRAGRSVFAFLAAFSAAAHLRDSMSKVRPR